MEENEKMDVNRKDDVPEPSRVIGSSKVRKGLTDMLAAQAKRRH